MRLLEEESYSGRNLLIPRESTPDLQPKSEGKDRYPSDVFQGKKYSGYNELKERGAYWTNSLKDLKRNRESPI